MGTAAKNILIGIFVIIAIAIIIFILLFLHPTVGDNAKTLRVRFTNIEKITLGTRVTYAGKPVGEVISIQEMPDARNDRKARNGDIYVYELLLKVDSGVSVYNTDNIKSYTSGLLGERGIEINPEPLKPGEKLVLVEDEILYANPARSLEESLQKFEKVAEQINKVLDNIDHTIDEVRKEGIVAETGKTVRDMREITETLNQPDKWKEILDNALAFSKDMRQSLKKFDTTLDNLHICSGHANDIFAYIKEGKGSLGQIIINEDLYLRIKALFGKADTVVDDIQNFGLLFQNNKRWQRLNAQRRNLMRQLCRPEVFEAYFSNQLWQASNSVGLVTNVLNQNGCSSENLANNPEYIKNYGKLMHQVEDLKEDISMYNQQVIDQDSLYCGDQ